MYPNISIYQHSSSLHCEIIFYQYSLYIMPDYIQQIISGILFTLICSPSTLD